MEILAFRKVRLEVILQYDPLRMHRSSMLAIVDGFFGEGLAGVGSFYSNMSANHE
jgi:hypothetical protein